MSLEDRSQLSLRARAHPVRLRMLSLLTGAAMSAAELGRELGISQALASYHLRFLVNAGAVTLAEEVRHRGGRERRYRYRAEASAEDSPWPAGHTPEGYELLLTAAGEELRRRAHQRDPDGPGLMVDAELWVTDEQWTAFRDAVRDASLRLHQQAARPRTSGTKPVNVSAFLFTMSMPAASVTS